MASVRREDVRRTIKTMCDLRETEAEAAKCISRADRRLDLRFGQQREMELRRRCHALRKKLATLEAPRKVPRLRDEIEGRFRRGMLLTPRTALRPEHRRTDDVDGVASIADGWYVPVAQIDGLRTIKEVLSYLERKKRNWRTAQLSANPLPSVPRCVSTSDHYATLQNLPAWQSARICLVASALSNRSVSDRELSRWFRELDVHEAYTGKLRDLRTEMVHKRRTHGV